MSKLIQKKAAEQAENIRAKEQVQDVVASVGSKKRKAEEPAPVVRSAKAAKNNKKKAAQTGDKSSIIYLGHLPQGFFEPQLKKFFMQFGIVRKLKLFRSPETGGSRGFAFLQFESAETAQTVSDAMHGYFLHDRQLVSHVVPTSKHHEGMWKMRKPTVEMLDEASKEEKKVTEKKEDSESLKKKQDDKVKRLAEKQSKLNALGIDFQIPALKC
jgi:nucleolar protein 15